MNSAFFLTEIWGYRKVLSMYDGACMMRGSFKENGTKRDAYTSKEIAKI